MVAAGKDRLEDLPRLVDAPDRGQRVDVPEGADGEGGSRHAEIVRGAFQSIPKGQMEAGKAIGLVFRQRLAYILIPQATRRFIPPFINSVVDAVKGSALVSLVGVVDLMQAIQQVVGRTYQPLPVYVMGALIYFAINYALSLLARRLEARFAYIRNL